MTRHRARQFIRARVWREFTLSLEPRYKLDQSSGFCLLLDAHGFLTIPESSTLHSYGNICLEINRVLFATIDTP